MYSLLILSESINMQLFIFLAPLPLPPEDGCMEPKHVVEEEQESKKYK
jgi:hypothetical protein